MSEYRLPGGIGRSVAENADCVQAMKQYPDGYFDLAVVDPPYGGEPAVAYGFIYKQGAKAGSVGAGEVAPTIKTDQPPAVAYANGTETVVRTLTARADGSPMLDRGQNAVIQKGNEHERMVEEK